MCYNGIGVKRDFAKAFKWYEAAAKSGNVNAQYSLSLLYFNGHGVNRDDIKAYAWMTLVAVQGRRDRITAAEYCEKPDVISAADGS